MSKSSEVVRFIFSKAKEWKSILLNGGSFVADVDSWKVDCFDEDWACLWMFSGDLKKSYFFDFDEKSLVNFALDVRNLNKLELLYATAFFILSAKACESNFDFSDNFLEKKFIDFDIKKPISDYEKLLSLIYHDVYFKNCDGFCRALNFLTHFSVKFVELKSDEKSRLLNNSALFYYFLDKISSDSISEFYFSNLLCFIFFPNIPRINNVYDKIKIAESFIGRSEYDIYSGYEECAFPKYSLFYVDNVINEISLSEEKFLIDFYTRPLLESWHKGINFWMIKWDYRFDPLDFFANGNGLGWDMPSLHSNGLFSSSSADSEIVLPVFGELTDKIKVGDTVFIWHELGEEKGIIGRGHVLRSDYFNKDCVETLCLDLSFEKSKYLTRSNNDGGFLESLIPFEYLVENYGFEDKIEPVMSLSSEIAFDLIERLPHLFLLKKKDILILNYSSPVNHIFYGPPGTGKTHALNSEIRVYEKMHSISTDSAWIQENVEGLEWWEVLFMALYEHKQKASISELIEHPFILEKRQLSKLSEAETRSICWEALQSYTTVDAASAKRDVNTRRVPYVFDMDLDNSYHLARSGDWKESCAVLIERVKQIMAGPSDEERKIDKRYAFVTFHQSYSYEDFIEGIRPEPAPHGQGVSYAVKPGVFKRLCERARRDPEQRYAIFIDEINRGNVAKIFGELITLIEIDKRARYGIDGTLLQGMELTLPYSGERFGVPFNVDIFGTMNTADRSIALLDVALRRRFEFVELMPQPDVIPGNDDEGNILDTEGQSINLRKLLAAINKRIEYFLHRDQTIGHAFFMSVTTLEELKEVLAKKIIPLLQETFYNNWENIRLVLGDVNVPIACQLVRKITVSVEDVFGFAHDELPDSTRYEVCDVSDMTAAAIRSIYEPVV